MSDDLIELLTELMDGQKSILETLKESYILGYDFGYDEGKRLAGDE